jgi:hypothetical protein
MIHLPAAAPRLLPALLLAALAGPAFAQITPGNLVVVRVGDGAAALTNAGQAVFLDEYTTAGALVQSLPLPTVGNGADQPLVMSGTATSEGILTLSPNGQWLVCAGYAAAPGTASIASTTAVAAPRVAARVALDGSIDTETTFAGLFSGNNVRSAVTDDGLQFWAAGGNGGIVHAVLGGGTVTALNTTAPTNNRVVAIAGGQLYCTSGSGSTRGVIAVGTGLPTTAGQTLALLPGFPTATASPYDFFFADANTVYVADDRTSGGAGGIQKWTLAAGTWSLQYTLAPAATTGCRGLSGIVAGGVTTLYATTTTTPLNDLVAVVDTGAGSTFTTLATAGTNTVLRGVRFVAVPHQVAFAGTGSPTTVGVPTIAPGNGLPVLGNLAFTVEAGNLVPFGFGFGLLGIGALGPGFPVAGAPATVQVYVTPLATVLVLADGLGAGSVPFAIPAVGALAGLPVPAQVVAFDAAMVDAVPIGTSVGLQLVVGY